MAEGLANPREYSKQPLGRPVDLEFELDKWVHLLSLSCLQSICTRSIWVGPWPNQTLPVAACVVLWV